MAKTSLCACLLLLVAVLSALAAEEQCSAEGPADGGSCGAAAEAGGEEQGTEEAAKKRKGPTRKQQMERLVMENMDLRRALWDTRDQMAEYLSVVEKWAEGAIGDMAKEALRRSQARAALLERKQDDGEVLSDEEEEYKDIFGIQAKENTKLISLNLVPRFAGDETSFKDFYERYAGEMPAVITDMDLPMKDWSLEWLTQMCGPKPADTIYRHNSSFPGWGALETAVEPEEAPTLADFLAAFDGKPSKLNVSELYLHDWPLPTNCPELLEHESKGFTVPKFFSQDYLKRISAAAKENNLPYANDFPSLFVGQAGTQTGMHVDSFGSNFWMYLIGGRKEWHFYLPQDRVFLGEDRARRAFEADSFNPNFTANPLFHYARGWRVIQEPGEVVYVPEGIPHQVRNLEDTVAVSVNFIDGSNFQAAAERLYRDGDIMSTEIFKLLTDPKFNGEMRMDPREMTWNEYKAHRVVIEEE